MRSSAAGAAHRGASPLRVGWPRRPGISVSCAPSTMASESWDYRLRREPTMPHKPQALGRALLLSSDQQNSILQHAFVTERRRFAYTAFGFDAVNHAALSHLGFNGHTRTPVIGSYLLGNGRRAYNPCLMQFTSPDNLSPFGKGGLNAYAYCLGDPINRQDPSGNFPVFKSLAKVYRRFSPRKENLPATVYEPVITETEKHTINYRNIPDQYTMNVVGQSDRIPNDYELIGFHGSQEKHAKSLEAGIDASYSKRHILGRGFYASPSYRHANIYAGKQGRVFGVYAKDVDRWREGVQYDRPGSDIMIIRSTAFTNTIVRSEIRMPLRHLHPLQGDSI